MMQQSEDDFRRNREQYTVQLRKQNRESLFKKRRTAEHAPNSQSMQGENNTRLNLIVDPKLKPLIQNLMLQAYSPTQLEELCLGLAHEDIEVKHRAAIGLRVVISEVENFDLMQRVIDAGCVPLLIAFMRQTEYPQLQLEATWTLTNIACGRTSQCQSIVDKQGLDAFIQLVRENRPHIAEQALWGLGNIAGDSPKFRDAILQKQALGVVIKAIQTSSTVSMLEQGAWVLANLCRGTPRPKYQLVKSAVPILARVVMSGTVKEDIVVSCLWAIAANSETQKSRIQKVVEIKGFVSYLMEQAKTASNAVLIGMLKIIGNISNGNQVHTQQLLKAGCLSLFFLLLDHPKTPIRRQVCWILSNICVGTSSQLAQILACTPLVQKLGLLFQSGESSVKLEISYIFANMCHCGEPQEIFKVMAEYQLLESLMQLIMEENDGKCLVGGLNALFEALMLGKKSGKQENAVFLRLEHTNNFLNRLEELQKHDSAEVYKKLVKILQTFFKVDTATL